MNPLKRTFAEKREETITTNKTTLQTLLADATISVHTYKKFLNLLYQAKSQIELNRAALHVYCANNEDCY